MPLSQFLLVMYTNFWDNQCGSLRNRSTTDQVSFLLQILKKGVQRDSTSVTGIYGHQEDR